MNKYMMGFLGMALAFSVAPAMAATVQTDQGAPADVSVNIPVNLTIDKWCDLAFVDGSFDLKVGPNADGTWNGDASDTVALQVTSNFAATLAPAFSFASGYTVDDYGIWDAVISGDNGNTFAHSMDVVAGADAVSYPVKVSVGGVPNTTPWQATTQIGTCTVTITAK